MPDWRLDSCHLGTLPRRHGYRRAREALQAARGAFTWVAERACDWAEGVEDWPSELLPRPDQVLPGPRYLLVDPQADSPYRLKPGINTLGRMPNSDLVFSEMDVSRRHCVLLVHARGRCELHDTASLNGTFVNGRRVHEPVRLASGDRVRLSSRELLFVGEGDYQSAAPGDGGTGTVVLSAPAARCYSCNAPLPSAGGPYICGTCHARLSAPPAPAASRPSLPAGPPQGPQTGRCEFCPAEGPAGCAVCGAYLPGAEAVVDHAPAPAA